MDAGIAVRGAERGSHPWLGRIIFGLDKWLRRRHSVIEYTNNPQCICRIEIKDLERHIALADGTSALRGDRAIVLHLWNEQIPLMSKRGASFAWALRMRQGFEISLYELARYLAGQSELDDVLVVHGKLAVGGKQNPGFMRLIARFGFEAAAVPPPVTMLQKGQWLAENVLISLMVWARNSAALHRDTLARGRTQFFLSRRTLEHRYGPNRSQFNPVTVLADTID